MATRTKKTNKTTAVNAANTNKPEMLEIGSAAISDIRERWSDGDTVLFDIVLFKSIRLYGLTGRFDDNNEFWVSFPARKGNDGKYYKHMYATFTSDALVTMEKALYPEETTK